VKLIYQPSCRIGVALSLFICFLIAGICLSGFGLKVTRADEDSEKNKCQNFDKIPVYEQNLESFPYN